jgi:hypothetical protein
VAIPQYRNPRIQAAPPWKNRVVALATDGIAADSKTNASATVARSEGWVTVEIASDSLVLRVAGGARAAPPAGSIGFAKRQEIRTRRLM